MGKIIKFDTCKKINGFVNDYINIQKEYEKNITSLLIRILMVLLIIIL